MNNNKAKCPSCGAEGTAGKECEYCGTMIPMPRPEYSNEIAPVVRILKFRTTKEDAIEKMLIKLTEEKFLPTDFFRNIQITEVQAFYVPSYYFECNFEAPWSCVKLEREGRKVYNKTMNRYETEYVTQRYPMNGVAMGRYNGLMCSRDIEGWDGDFPLFVIDLIDLLPAKELFNMSIDSRMNDDELAILVRKGQTSSKALWEKSQVRKMERCVERAVNEQLPDWYEDLSYSCKYETDFHDLILPIWYIKYTYKDTEFGFVTDGLTKEVDYSFPEDDDKVSKHKLKSENMKKRKKSRNIYVALFIIVSIITIITSFCSWRRLFHEYFVAAIYTTILIPVVLFLMKKTTSAIKSYLLGKTSLKITEMNNILEQKLGLAKMLEHNRWGMNDGNIARLAEAIKAQAQEIKAQFQETKAQFDKIGHMSKTLWVKIVAVLVVAWGIVSVFVGVNDYIEDKNWRKSWEQFQRTKGTNDKNVANDNDGISIAPSNQSDSVLFADNVQYDSVTIDQYAINEILLDRRYTYYGQWESSQYEAQPCKLEFEKNGDALVNCAYTNLKYNSRIPLVGEIRSNSVHFVGGKEGKQLVIDLQITQNGNSLVGEGIDHGHNGDRAKLTLTDANTTLSFGTFTERTKDNGQVIHFRVGNETAATKLKEMGFQLLDRHTESRPDYTGEEYYDVVIETYSRTEGDKTTTVKLDEYATVIHFPTLQDVEAFKNTVASSGLKRNGNDYEDNEKIYWAGTDVSIRGTIVTLNYKWSN